MTRVGFAAPQKKKYIYNIYMTGSLRATCGYGEGLSGSINARNFLTSCKVHWLASQEGLCSME